MKERHMLLQGDVTRTLQPKAVTTNCDLKTEKLHGERTGRVIRPKEAGGLLSCTPRDPPEAAPASSLGPTQP